MAEKLYFKIGEACKDLDIQPYVLRYWETEFPVLKPTKSKSGQRVYSRQDLDTIRRIKELLYDEGFTIAGAKKKLEEEPLTRPRAKSEPKLVEAKTEPKPKPTAKRTAKPAHKAKATAASSKPKLDKATAKEVKLLRSGIRDSIKEARAILAILDGASPND
jgi:DNA-binding transcriptional MerR regulator